MALYNTAEAAKYLRVTPGRVRQYLQDGLLVGKRVGRDWVIDLADLEHFVKPAGTPGRKARKTKKK